MTEEGQASNRISMLLTMLSRLKVNTSQHTSLSKDLNPSECEFTQEPGSLEWGSPEEAYSEISVSPDNSETILRNDNTEDPPSLKLGANFQQSSPPLIVGTREQASSVLHNSTEETGQVEQPSKSPPVCGNMETDPHWSQESLPQTPVYSFIKGTTVSKENEMKLKRGPTPPKPPRSKLKLQGCKHDVDRKATYEAEEMLNKDNHITKKDMESRFFGSHENPTSKSTQSLSDVGNSSRRDSSVSDPVCPREAGMYIKKAQESPEHEAEVIDCDSASFNIQKKVKSENNMETFAQNLKANLKEKNSPETQSVSSEEENELPDRSQHYPKEESTSAVQVRLQRTFTLRDFTFALEPINLLEEILIGEEWANFLPVKDEPPQAEARNQSQMEKPINGVEEFVTGKECASFLPVKDRTHQAEDNVYSKAQKSCHLNDDIQSQNLVINQDKSTDQKQSATIQSEKDQVNIGHLHVGQLDGANQEKRRQGEKDSSIFVVPKALISNCAIKQQKPDVPQKDHKDHVYDFIEVLMFPNNITKKPKSKDFPPLDLSAVKSLGVLDSSALKSRILLSRKRKHRPPKLRKKGKSEVTQNFKTFMDCSYDHSTSSPTESPQASSMFPSSVFYSLPQSSVAPVSVTPALNEKKEKAKEAGGKLKIWKLKT
ncbi:uncharacterized protein LOC143475960 [Brachyhypopomus gauderio]|uniref:uncharacterized protein LOC143475960 n=1 Tax=Brachyhypopomus gauderio TaxID=698409 RepID=UPI004041E0FF